MVGDAANILPTFRPSHPERKIGRNLTYNWVLFDCVPSVFHQVRLGSKFAPLQVEFDKNKIYSNVDIVHKLFSAEAHSMINNNEGEDK